jgi:TPR repeat protein
MFRALILFFLMSTGAAVATEREVAPWFADTWVLARAELFDDPVLRMIYVSRTLSRDDLGHTAFNSAVHTLKRAAEQHYKPAQLMLADFYQRGVGVRQDLIKALGLYRVLARDGDIYALVQMGFIHMSSCECGSYNPHRAVHYFRVGAEAHFGLAYLGLAEAYEYGMGVPADRAKSRLWYERAVAKKVPAAFYPLGRLYQSARASERSEERAVALFRIGAGLGDRDSAFGLGEALINGRGVGFDLDEGRRLLQPLAQTGHGRAQEALGLSYFKGKRFPPPSEVRPGIAWLELAGANGVGTAYETLANYYMMEVRDYDTALYYAHLGTASPDRQAAENLEALIPLLEEYQAKGGGGRET